MMFAVYPLRCSLGLLGFALRDSAAAPPRQGAARTRGCTLAGVGSRIRGASGSERPRVAMSSPAPIPSEIHRVFSRCLTPLSLARLGADRRRHRRSPAARSAPMLVLRLVALLAASTSAALLTALPPSVVDGLSKRGITTPTPVQAAALDRALSGESLVLHAETGSGKSLAFMLPALCRMQQDPASQLLVLSPTRELCSQLGDELGALLRDGALGEESEASVRMVTPGTRTRADDLLAARVIVATPAELCQLLAPKDGQSTAGAGEGEDGAQGHGLAETLARQVGTLVLDEVDALVPGKKEFRGKRHWKWMDRGMHPAEAPLPQPEPET